MEIEIITTKKKLSKSIINQMPAANKFELKNGIVLGYVLGIVKDSFKTGIILFDNEYYVFALNWKCGEKTVYRKVGRYSSSIEFSCETECQEWWKFYVKARDEALKTHIYI